MLTGLENPGLPQGTEPWPVAKVRNRLPVGPARAPGVQTSISLCAEGWRSGGRLLCFFMWTNRGRPFKWEALFDRTQALVLKKPMTQRGLCQENLSLELA